MSSPNAKQYRFLGYMADLGCCVSQEDWRIQMHHIFGRSAKVKGVGNIGHWAVIPLAYRYHDVNSNDPLNVTHHKNAFSKAFSEEVQLWHQCLMALTHKAKTNKSINPADFPPSDVVDAIMRYTR